MTDKKKTQVETEAEHKQKIHDLAHGITVVKPKKKEKVKDDCKDD